MCPAFSYRVLVQQSSRDQHINPSLSFSLRWASESGMQECASPRRLRGGRRGRGGGFACSRRFSIQTDSHYLQLHMSEGLETAQRLLCFFTRCVYSCFLCNFAVLSPSLKWTRWCVSSRALWARLSLCSCRSVSPALLVRRRASSHQCITALTDTLACFTAKKEVEMSLFVPAHSWHCLLRCNLFRLN